MSKTTGFVEAPVESPYWDALWRRDCRQLMNLLEENPCRVVQKGFRGRTVLHAAAVRGCLKLLDQVFDLFGDNRQFVDEKEGIKLSLWEFCDAQCIDSVDERVGLTAADCAWWSMGKCDPWRQLLDSWRVGGRTFVSYQSEVFRSSSGEAKAAAEGSVSPRTLLLEVLRHNLRLLYERAQEEFEKDERYNFVADCEELRFHHACARLLSDEYGNYGMDEMYGRYVEAVIGGCVEKGPHVLSYLFQLRNAQGETPLHVAVKGHLSCDKPVRLFPGRDFPLRNAQVETPLHVAGNGHQPCDKLVRWIPGRESGENAECLNVRDARGWTALNLASSLGSACGVRVLLDDGRVDVNATMPGAIPFGEALGLFEDSEQAFAGTLGGGIPFVCHQGGTALHVAVMHNKAHVVKMLLADSRTDVNARFDRPVQFEENLRVVGGRWTALQWAALAGLPEVVKLLIACPKVEDVGKRQKKRNCDRGIDEVVPWCMTEEIPATHFAAISGDPETLRLFITNREYDPLTTWQGSTSLHFVVPATQPWFWYGREKFPQEYVYFCNIDSYVFCIRKDVNIANSHSGREACINLLVQAGVDVWQQDDEGNFPEPGRLASSEYHLAWQQKVEKETLEAKKGLNEAGNAISVVAALVATASYVGPLQPPLGYANDLVQSSNLSVRIFMVSNSTSFYLAIASILFAVVPSLPMPQEGIYEEWQRTRHTIGIAISLLLMSVLGILISFAAASNAVVPEEYSWQHGGITFYPVVVGGLVCLIGVVWFFIRLLRLIFPKSVMVRHMYQSIFKIKGKGK